MPESQEERNHYHMNYITFSTVSTVSILGVFLVVFSGLGSVGVADDLGLIC